MFKFLLEFSRNPGKEERREKCYFTVGGGGCVFVR